MGYYIYLQRLLANKSNGCNIGFKVLSKDLNLIPRGLQFHTLQ